jgi:hypothetical protein
MHPAPNLSQEQCELMHVLGFTYLLHGHAESAAILFQALHALFPDQLVLCQSLALAQLRQNAAQAALHTLAGLPDGTALTELLRAWCLIRLNQPEAARLAMRAYLGARAGAHHA